MILSTVTIQLYDFITPKYCIKSSRRLVLMCLKPCSRSATMMAPVNWQVAKCDMSGHWPTNWLGRISLSRCNVKTCHVQTCHVWLTGSRTVVHVFVLLKILTMTMTCHHVGSAAMRAAFDRERQHFFWGFVRDMQSWPHHALSSVVRDRRGRHTQQKLSPRSKTGKIHIIWQYAWSKQETCRIVLQHSNSEDSTKAVQVMVNPSQESVQSHHDT